jgi:hypothetical protein
MGSSPTPIGARVLSDAYLVAAVLIAIVEARADLRNSWETEGAARWRPF